MIADDWPRFAVAGNIITYLAYQQGARGKDKM